MDEMRKRKRRRIVCASNVNWVLTLMIFTISCFLVPLQQKCREGNISTDSAFKNGERTAIFSLLGTVAATVEDTKHDDDGNKPEENLHYESTLEDVSVTDDEEDNDVGEVDPGHKSSQSNQNLIQSKEDDDHIDLIEEENGIIVLRKIEDFRLALSPKTKQLDDQPRQEELVAGLPPLMLLIVYSSACQHGNDLVYKVEHVRDMMRAYVEEVNLMSNTDSRQSSANAPTVVFGKIDMHSLDDDDQIWLEKNIIKNNNAVGIPLLLFVRGHFFKDDIDEDNISSVNDATDTKTTTTKLNDVKVDDNDSSTEEKNQHHRQFNESNSSNMNVEIMDYLGKPTESEHIFKTVLHYWYRFIVTDVTVNSDIDEDTVNASVNDAADVVHGAYHNVVHDSSVFVGSSYSDMINFLNIHGNGLFQFVKPAFHPDMSESEKQYVAWLMQPNEKDDDYIPRDGYVLFVQCRSSLSSMPRETFEDYPKVTSNISSYYEHYDGIARIMTNRRDVAFFTLKKCDILLGDDDVNKNKNKNNNHNGEGNLHLQDGEVVSWLVSTRQTTAATPQQQLNDWSNLLSTDKSIINIFHVPTEQPDNPEDIKPRMTEFIVRETTPLIMWFDRKSVGPIAFPFYRKVHVILFVDMHNHLRYDVMKLLSNDDIDKNEENTMSQLAPFVTRNAIESLRKASLFHRRQRWRLKDKQQSNWRSRSLLQNMEEESDIVFLVVPSTETRIMNTFGIDIWSPLDEMATSSSSSSKEEEKSTTTSNNSNAVLPTLLITDQRMGGTQRHYLDATDIIEWSNDLEGTKIMPPIEQFLQDFRDDKLRPEAQSQKKSPPATKTNMSGVQILTGNTFEEMVLNRETKHTLLYIYAPTCGHCKRFSLIWNDLSKLIRYLGWDAFIDVMKMDITQNEIVVTERFPYYMDIKETPDVYYFPSGEKGKKPIRYDVIDDFGDGVGRLSDPMEFMKWFLDVSTSSEKGGLDESLLLKSLLKEQ